MGSGVNNAFRRGARIVVLATGRHGVVVSTDADGDVTVRYPDRRTFDIPETDCFSADEIELVGYVPLKHELAAFLETRQTA